MKKVLTAIVLSAALVLGSVAPAFAATSPTESTGTVATVTTKQVTAKTAEDLTAAVTKTKNKATVSIPATVTSDGKTYKVTTIKAKAVAKKVKTLKVGKNITKIQAKAFSNAKKLKTIQIKGTKKITINKKAFKGVSTKKMTIKVNKKMSAKNYKALKKALKKAGFNGTIKKVKM